MVKVSLKPFFGNIFLKNQIFDINNGNNIFFKLNKRIKKHNVDLNTIDIQPLAEAYIYCDVPYPWQINDWLNLLSHISKNILLCFESPLINPFSHIRITTYLFKKIYNYDSKAVDNQKIFKFYIPQLSEGTKTKAKEFKDRKLLTLINSKKGVPPLLRLFSLGKRNLYVERNKAIKFFQKAIPGDFALFGKGWSISDTPVYKGEIPGKKKIQALSNYKFCICFENTVVDGYITEKIFDCLKARCIPIYWGAPDIKKFIPSGCFIDFGDFNYNYGSLLKYLKLMTEEKFTKHIEEINKLLSNKNFLETWFEEGFQKTLLSNIKNSC